MSRDIVDIWPTAAGKFSLLGDEPFSSLRSADLSIGNFVGDVRPVSYPWLRALHDKNGAANAHERRKVVRFDDRRPLILEGRRGPRRR